MIQHLCPLEWKLLTESGIKSEISPELIDKIAIASDDDFFHSEAYRKALIDYRKFGVATPNRIIRTVAKEIKYAKIRRQKRLQK